MSGKLGNAVQASGPVKTVLCQTCGKIMKTVTDGKICSSCLIDNIFAPKKKPTVPSKDPDVRKW